MLADLGFGKIPENSRADRPALPLSCGVCEYVYFKNDLQALRKGEEKYHTVNILLIIFENFEICALVQGNLKIFQMALLCANFYEGYLKQSEC